MQGLGSELVFRRRADDAGKGASDRLAAGSAGVISAAGRPMDCERHRGARSTTDRGRLPGAGGETSAAVPGEARAAILRPTPDCPSHANSRLPAHVLLPGPAHDTRHAPHAERAGRPVRRSLAGPGGSGRGGGGDPARGRPRRDCEFRSGGLPGADSGGCPGHLRRLGGLRGQQLDGRLGGGVCRERGDRGAPPYPHCARRVRGH